MRILVRARVLVRVLVRVFVPMVVRVGAIELMRVAVPRSIGVGMPARAVAFDVGFVVSASACHAHDRSPWVLTVNRSRSRARASGRRR
jgi:hypothetical protein